MKEFEKWRIKNCEENCDIGVDSGLCHYCSGLGTKEDAWKAALEWANFGLNKFHISEELEQQYKGDKQ